MDPRYTGSPRNGPRVAAQGGSLIPLESRTERAIGYFLRVFVIECALTASLASVALVSTTNDVGTWSGGGAGTSVGRLPVNHRRTELETVAVAASVDTHSSAARARASAVSTSPSLIGTATPVPRSIACNLGMSVIGLAVSVLPWFL